MFQQVQQAEEEDGETWRTRSKWQCWGRGGMNDRKMIRRRRRGDRSGWSGRNHQRNKNEKQTEAEK